MLGISHHVASGNEVVTEDHGELLYGKIRKFGTDFLIIGTDFLIIGTDFLIIGTSFLIYVRVPYYMYARAYIAYARK